MVPRAIVRTPDDIRRGVAAMALPTLATAEANGDSHKSSDDEHMSMPYPTMAEQTVAPKAVVLAAASA